MGKMFSCFAVYIDEVKSGSLEGWFMNPYIQEFVTFRDLGEMVIKMDENLRLLVEQEKRGEPSKMTCYHSFRDFVFQSKPHFFYLIEILYTNHQSWQGLLTGTNRPRITFRSTLDCIRIMDHAIQEKRSQGKQA